MYGQCSLQMVSGNRMSRDALPLIASSVMASLKKIWRDRRLSLPITIRTYKALVYSILLYAAEPWTLRAEDAQTLESFHHMKCQRQILSIRWQDHDIVRNIEVINQTGLPLVMEHVVKAATLFSDTLPGCQTLSQLTRLCTVKSSCHSADYPTRRGSVVQVAPTSDGWTRFATITTVHPLTCGEMLSDEVILKRRNGPRRLSDNDDDIHRVKTASGA